MQAARTTSIAVATVALALATLATSSGAHADPPARISIASDSACPSAEAVAHALAPLLPKAAIEVVATGADAQVHDDGARFRVSYAAPAAAGSGSDAAPVGKTIVDPQRECGERAETAAVVIAFAADPLAVPTLPTVPERVEPTPVPAPIAVPAATDRRFALDAAGLAEVAGANSAFAAGGALRAYAGSEQLGAVIGVSAASPITVATGTTTARMTRVPIDVGARLRLPRGPLVWAAEAGATFGPLFMSSPGVTRATSITTTELGGRLAVRAELASPTWSPFVALEVDVVASHPLLVDGAMAGATPSAWAAAVLGLEARL